MKRSIWCWFTKSYPFWEVSSSDSYPALRDHTGQIVRDARVESICFL